ncbi:MAG: hypothetical protein NTY90_03085 [Candidatus Micrarchaeota archaeon]|nr:hypothetical protein [Candidatus Micrarchaeota archaeon]
MPRISEEKTRRICEHILELIYSTYPSTLFTAEIAVELARDEEFVKRLLEDLEKKGLVARIKTSEGGDKYVRRSRWALSKAAKEKYDEAA